MPTANARHLLDVERRTTDLETRLDRLERTLLMDEPAPETPSATTTLGTAWPPEPTPLPAGFPSIAAGPPVVMPPPREFAPEDADADADAPERPDARPATAPLVSTSFEDLVGGRVLAWVGGIAVLLGVAFFLAIAVSRGWVGEELRCLLAAAGGLALVSFGAKLRHRDATPEAAVAAIGAGIAVLDVTIAVASQTYNVIPAWTGVALALVVGAGAVVLALRTGKPSPTIAAFGILGGLLSPVLAGLATDGASIALLLAISVPAAAMLVAQRWDVLALGAFAVTLPQLLLYLVDTPSTPATLLALSGFGAIWIAQAVGFELRTAAPTLRPASAFLLTAQALVLAATGALVLHANGDAAVADAWLFGLAIVHLAVGLATDRLRRVSRELGLLSLSLGVVLADVAIGSALNGVAVPIAYAVGALAFAGLARALPRTQADHAFVLSGLGGHVLLAAAHALVVDAPTTALAGGDLLAASVALATVAATSFAAARIATQIPALARMALDTTALLVLAWLAVIVLPPVGLAVAWAAQGAALAQVARRAHHTDGHDDDEQFVAVAAAAHLIASAVVALATFAPAQAIVDGLTDPLAAALGLGALAIALARAAAAAPLDQRAILYPAAGLTALYLASVEVVTPLSPHAGQVALSVLWGVAGVATLVAGLMLDRRTLRLGGLCLLVATIVKVFLIDLATLDSAARAGSFLALGVLLLGAAYAWQRQRPAAVAPAPAATPEAS
ncbi:DUF2339 domain-containing protein [Baekduia sp. Peel2402]|uniref:DUF2339 domain-containing protein n=1 Tax=Baekduia sp. Peel2402 TaxID=3458296 RepID=UPI00403ED094